MLIIGFQHHTVIITKNNTMTQSEFNCMHTRQITHSYTKYHLPTADDVTVSQSDMRKFEKTIIKVPLQV